MLKLASRNRRSTTRDTAPALRGGASAGAPALRGGAKLVWLILVLSASAAAQAPAQPGQAPPKKATVAQMTQLGAAVVRKGEGTARSVRAMLEEARKAAD